MKAFTDLAQSKRLAEILPIESADQTWERIAIAGANLDVPEEMQYGHNGNVPFIRSNKIGIPCWSLAALLNYLREIDCFPEIGADKFEVTMDISFYDVEDECRLVPMHSIKAKTEDFIDTCYEMILKMREQKLF